MSAERTRWVCIHQPCYLPWLGLFHKIKASAHYVVLDDCQLSHRTWINRVHIARGDTRQLLSVPVHFSLREGTLVRDVRIDHSKNWRRKHDAAIRQNYARASHFGELAELLDLVYGVSYDYLIDLNLAAMSWVFERFGMDVRLTRSSELDDHGAQGTERLAHLVKAVGGSGYFSGAGSDGYLEPDLFERHGLALDIQRFEAHAYPQRGATVFLPGLSVVDAIANLGMAGAARLLHDQAAPGSGARA
jgi:hypothetical protein